MCPNYCVACSHFAPVVGDVPTDEPGSIRLWLSSWLEDGNSQTFKSPSWFMQVGFGSAISCKRICCLFSCTSDMVKGGGSSPISSLWIITCTSLTWGTKMLFSIYSSTAEVEHSLWWNGTSPPGPETLACHIDTFLGKTCFVISQFYSQKNLFYQPANPQVGIIF